MERLTSSSMTIMICCDGMLEEWLEVDPSASWEKLLKVIKSLSSDHKGESKGNLGVRPKVLCPLTYVVWFCRSLCFFNMVAQLNLQARFQIDDNAWPLDQPKNFTPLVLIHYKGHHNLQQAIAITKLTQTGDISSLASNQPVPKEALGDSTVINKVEEILTILEKNDKPQFILIEGPPGVGKSVLLKEIAYR